MGRYLTVRLWDSKKDFETWEEGDFFEVDNICSISGDYRHDMGKFNDWSGTPDELKNEIRQFTPICSTKRDFKTLGFLANIISESLDDTGSNFILISNW